MLHILDNTTDNSTDLITPAVLAGVFFRIEKENGDRFQRRDECH